MNKVRERTLREKFNSELYANQRREIRASRRHNGQHLRHLLNIEDRSIDNDINSFASILHEFTYFLWKKDGDESVLDTMESMGNSESFIDCFTSLLVATDWYKRWLITEDYKKSIESKFHDVLNELDDITGEYVQMREELDRMKLISDSAKHTKKQMLKTHNITPPSKTDVCFVYIMRTNWNSKVVKIGISNSPKKREKTLRSEEDLSLWATEEFKTRSKARRVEKALHEEYDDYSKRGEWFELPSYILKQGLKEMIKDATNQNKTK